MGPWAQGQRPRARARAGANMGSVQWETLTKIGTWRNDPLGPARGPNGLWVQWALGPNGPWAQTGPGPNGRWAQTGPGPKRALGPMGPGPKQALGPNGAWAQLALGPNGPGQIGRGPFASACNRWGTYPLNLHAQT